MSAAKKNPFQVFGLTPEIAEILSEKDLFSLVKSTYRTLQKVYHPDRCQGKSPGTTAQNNAQAVDLNLAFEQLNLEKNPSSFKRLKKSYAGQRRPGLQKKVAELKKNLKNLEARESALADGYMQYLLLGLPWSHEDGQPDPCRVVPTPTNLKLGLNDVAINQNIKSASWSLGSNYKEIIFDALGGMYYRPVGRSKPFPVNFIHLLGSVQMSEIELLPLLDRVPPRTGFFKGPALDSRYGIDGAPLKVLNTITLEKFKKHCLPLLKPDFCERAYLFSLHRPLFEDEGTVSLEGVIVKISKP